MKPIELHKIISSLTASERKAVRSHFAETQDDQIQLVVLESLLKQSLFDRIKLERSCGVSGKKLGHVIKRLGNSVISRLAKIGGNDNTASYVAASARLILDLRDDVAAIIMKEAYIQAEELERFDIMLQLWELKDMMLSPLTIRGLSKENVLKRQMNMTALQNWLLKIKTLHESEMHQEGKVEAFRNFQVGILQCLPLSRRSERYYYECTSLIYQGIFEYENAEASHRKLKVLLERNTWLDNGEFLLARTSIEHIRLLMLNDNIDEAETLIFEAGAVGKNDKRSEFLKLRGLYVTRLAIASHKGDVPIGNEALETLLTTISKLDKFGGDEKHIRELYIAAHFCFCSGNFLRAKKILSRVLNCNRSAFRGYLYPMARFLDILILFECDVEDGLMVAIRKFRDATFYGGSIYFKLGTKLLSQLTKKGIFDHARILDNFESEFSLITKSHPEMKFMDSFDMGIWISSKRQKRTMSSVYFENAKEKNTEEISGTG